MKGTEFLQFACDQCFVHLETLSENKKLQRQLLDFWHADCKQYRCLRAHVIVVDDDNVARDEELLKTLAEPLWDQNSQDIRYVCVCDSSVCVCLGVIDCTALVRICCI